MSKELLPVGVRRDGSYYTRIEWTDSTVNNPLFWVCNLIDDDIERSGGTWGANTMGPANVVLSFFGEEQEISRVRFFHNVGLPISILEEEAKQIRMYISNTEEPRSLKADTDKIDDVPWELVGDFAMKKEMSWQEFVLDKPVTAKYVRIELVENFGTPPEIPWTETSELKIYP